MICPNQREYVLSTPLLQENTEWLLDLSTNIQCYWPLDTREALCLDEETGLRTLTEQAKVRDVPGQGNEISVANIVQERKANLSAWSVAPTIRAYVPIADLYVSMRSEYG